MGMNPRLLRPTATGFDPRRIADLGLWLDAADASTLTLNGTRVSAWSDKSGNGRHAVMAVAALQPSAVGRTQNGRTVVDFNGANSLLIHAPADGVTNAAGAAIARNVSGLTIFMVAAWDSTATTQFAFNCRVSNAEFTRACLVNAAGSGIAAGGRRLDDDAFASASYTANTNVNVLTGVLDYSNSDAFIFQNGSLQASNLSFQTDGNTSDTDSASVEVGGAGNSYAFGRLDGCIGELIVYRRALSATERQRVERALGRKWGITVA